jgi:hypothetical protein|tara:strand:- start:272 stop:760 length:489 start_codon:yes stop_codon:yes gene_type:complete
MEIPVNPFDTPVPGQSLTDTPKNYPWENPARFAKVEDSSLHIWKELNKKDTLKRVIVLLEAGVPLEALTRTIVFSGFVEGAFSIDSALLLTPIVQKMLFSIGKAAGISKLKITSPKKNITQEMIKDLYKAKGYVSKNINMKKVKNKKDDKPKGLMSRTKGDK